MKIVSFYTELNQVVVIKQINNEQVIVEVNALPVIILNNKELGGFSEACTSLQEEIS
jgi:hypothetical protein